jgi:NADH-quinone oxidoreductase subunit L
MLAPAIPAALDRVFKPLRVVLENKYYMDWINENILARAARVLGMGLWKGGDQGVIEKGVVNASWKLVGKVAGVVRRLQSGYLYHYALVMIIGIVVLMSYFVTWPTLRVMFGL